MLVNQTAIAMKAEAVGSSTLVRMYGNETKFCCERAVWLLFWPFCYIGIRLSFVGSIPQLFVVRLPCPLPVLCHSVELELCDQFLWLEPLSLEAINAHVVRNSRPSWLVCWQRMDCVQGNVPSCVVCRAWYVIGTWKLFQLYVFFASTAFTKTVLLRSDSYWWDQVKLFFKGVLKPDHFFDNLYWAPFANPPCLSSFIIIVIILAIW